MQQLCSFPNLEARNKRETRVEAVTNHNTDAPIATARFTHDSRSNLRVLSSQEIVVKPHALQRERATMNSNTQMSEAEAQAALLAVTPLLTLAPPMAPTQLPDSLTQLVRLNAV